MASNKKPLAVHFLVASGVLLVALGILHLWVTSSLTGWIARMVSVRARPLVMPPFVLNHIVVGILLIPVGISTACAALALPSGDRWARIICLCSALSVFSLPIVLLRVMDLRQFAAPPFVTAIILLFVISALMLLATVMMWLQKPAESA